MIDPDTLNTEKVIENLFLAVQYVYEGDVAGDVAEFGTCGGVTAQALARAMKCHGRHDWAPRKTLRLFDSFTGLPHATSEVDKNAPHVQKGWWKAGSCSCPIGEKELRVRVCQYLPHDQVAIHAGWFCNELPKLPPETRFSLLHVDCDLYQSAKDVLDYVLGNGLLSLGGMIVFDDYNCNRASPLWGERLAWLETAGKFSAYCDDLGCRGWSARSFIVHDYRGCPQ